MLACLAFAVAGNVHTSVMSVFSPRVFSKLTIFAMICDCAGVADVVVPQETCQPHAAGDHTLYFFTHIPKAGGSSLGE